MPASGMLTDMSGIESISQPKREQDILKQKLLNGEMPPTEVYAKLLELDQSTQDRHQAIANYEILTNEMVISFNQSQSQDAQTEYYRILGFTEFHLGQIKAIEDSAPEKALSFFKASLEHALLAQEHDEWTAYVASTVAYFENDLKKIEEVSQSPEITGNNRKIVENMKKGLRERGGVDYKQDYRVE